MCTDKHTESSVSACFKRKDRTGHEHKQSNKQTNSVTIKTDTKIQNISHLRFVYELTSSFFQHPSYCLLPLLSNLRQKANFAAWLDHLKPTKGK